MNMRNLAVRCDSNTKLLDIEPSIVSHAHPFLPPPTLISPLLSSHHSLAKPYQVLHQHIASKISSMDINKTALVPFYQTYSTGGIYGFYANGSASEATALMTVCCILCIVYCMLFSFVMYNLT